MEPVSSESDFKGTSASRRWFWTWNNPTLLDTELLNVLQEVKHIKFIVFQLEKAPTTGTEHFQGYCEFSQPVKHTAIRKAIPTPIWILVPKGTSEQCYSYCTKTDSRQDPDRSPMEWGKRSAGQGKSGELAQAAAMIKSGSSLREIAEEVPTAYVRHWRGLTELRQALQGARDPPQFRDAMRVIVFYGMAGIGKSRYFRHLCESQGVEFYVQSQESYQWWDFLKPSHTHVMCEEIDTKKVPLGTFKTLFDRYPFSAPVKGGFVPLNATTYYVTAQRPPEDWYPNLGQDRASFMRRLTQGESKVYWFNDANDYNLPDDFCFEPSKAHLDPRPNPPQNSYWV